MAKGMGIMMGESTGIRGAWLYVPGQVWSLEPQGAHSTTKNCHVSPLRITGSEHLSCPWPGIQLPALLDKYHRYGSLGSLNQALTFQKEVGWVLNHLMCDLGHHTSTLPQLPHWKWGYWHCISSPWPTILSATTFHIHPIVRTYWSPIRLSELVLLPLYALISNHET